MKQKPKRVFWRGIRWYCKWVKSNGVPLSPSDLTPHKPIFLTCMETTHKSDAILMKFTQDVCMDEKISWTKNL